MAIQLDSTAVVETVRLEHANALDRYACWEKPIVIVSDGPYGIDGYDGDLPKPDGLAEWYDPHIEAWARYALPETTLWFWNTEIGWATVHPAFNKHGWAYKACHIWNKGIGHIAGNVNGKTIRRFPVVTEVCVQYVRDVRLSTIEGDWLPLQQWLRQEWERTGLPLYKTNEACGIRNAASRKYFTNDHLWYFPPPEMMERLAIYANLHGRPTDHLYFSIDGKHPLNAEQWSHLRPKWNHEHGLTNVWDEPPVRGIERLKNGLAALHDNQKPLKLLRRIIKASSDANDVVWDPFGGLCSVSIAAMQLKRRCYSAEINEEYYELARKRLQHEGMLHKLFTDV